MTTFTKKPTTVTLSAITSLAPGDGASSTLTAIGSVITGVIEEQGQATTLPADVEGEVEQEGEVTE